MFDSNSSGYLSSNLEKFVEKFFEIIILNSSKTN